MDFCGRMYFYCFIILCEIFCHSSLTGVRAAKRATSETRSPGHLPSRDEAETTNLLPRSPSDRTITDKTCACEYYFYCNKSDIVKELPVGVSCGFDKVYCCKPGITTTTETSTANSVSTSTEMTENCKCVSAHKCKLTEEQKRVFTLNFRGFYCNELELCCPVNSIHHPDVDSPGSSKMCRCVSPQECRMTKEQLTSINMNPRASYCEELQTCCPIDQINPTPTDFPPATSTTPTENPEICQCVPTKKCRLTQRQRVTMGIDIRFNPGCDIHNTCCPPKYIENDYFVYGTRNTASEYFFNDSNTSFGEFPWMALLILTKIDPDTGNSLDNFIGGASLITPTHVLTGAHRLCGVSNVNLLKVRAGEYDTTVGNDKEHKPHQDRQVSKIVVHPEFHRNLLFNDLALLEVAEPFILDYHIRPINVPSVKNKNKYDLKNCITTGWGKKVHEPNSPPATILKKMHSEIISNNKCQQELRKTRLGPNFELDSSFVCARGKLGMADACESDGGGPLVCPIRRHSTRYVQMGVVAWGINCNNGIPGVYASLVENINWLANASKIISDQGSSIITMNLCPDIILKQVPNK